MRATLLSLTWGACFHLVSCWTNWLGASLILGLGAGVLLAFGLTITLALGEAALTQASSRSVRFSMGACLVVPFALSVMFSFTGLDHAWYQRYQDEGLPAKRQEELGKQIRLIEEYRQRGREQARSYLNNQARMVNKELAALRRRPADEVGSRVSYYEEMLRGINEKKAAWDRFQKPLPPPAERGSVLTSEEEATEYEMLRQAHAEVGRLYADSIEGRYVAEVRRRYPIDMPPIPAPPTDTASEQASKDQFLGPLQRLFRKDPSPVTLAWAGLAVAIDALPLILLTFLAPIISPPSRKREGSASLLATATMPPDELMKELARRKSVAARHGDTGDDALSRELDAYQENVRSALRATNAYERMVIQGASAERVMQASAELDLTLSRDDLETLQHEYREYIHQGRNRDAQEAGSFYGGNS